MTKAEGMYIFTDDGRKVLDFTGGIGVLNHGHNHPRILAARRAFMDEKRAEVHKNFLSRYIAGLSHNIAALLPDELKISYFCNSGGEAAEGAVKLAY
ncbi:MAG: aminotransferase class III-fold pyridoxal phosphate-dependent enzyme, partial [bacterium]|nr:aminotransferase class III-fold pyridoxal phosphate-dependent enzyme [bacterium]